MRTSTTVDGMVGAETVATGLSSSSSTMVTPGPKTSTFLSPGKSTSSRATSGMPSVKLPMANRKRAGSWEAMTDSSQSTSSCCRTVAPIEHKETQEAHERLQAICARLGNPELAERASNHEEYFPDTSVSLLYRPEDTRRQNIMVTIPGPSPEGRPNQQELVLSDVVYAREVLGGMWGSDWALGYAITVHSSQGFTIANPQKVWIIDEYLQW